MSLESKIEKLTKAIELLTVAVQSGQVSAPAEVKETVEDTVQKLDAEIVKEPVEETVKRNHDDLKKVCLAVARSGKKQEVKDVLANYDAVKAVDVALDKIDEVIGKLEEL